MMIRVMRPVILFSCLLTLTVGSGVRAEELDLLDPITAKAAIIIDHSDGRVLFERNADLSLPPASTTKILTSYIALTSNRLEESVLVTKYASSMPASKIGLRAGWWMNVNDLVYATLLNSANDASVVLAEGLAGSVPAFADQMNETARKLGATHSNFVNPNGLPDDEHYSSARDLVRILHYALRTPGFREALSVQDTTIWPVSGSARSITLRSHNRLLGNEVVNVVGKTGFTRLAKRCFVGAATYGGREVLVAVLGSSNLWGDLRRMIDYGLNVGNPEGFHALLTDEMQTQRVPVTRMPIEGVEQANNARALRNLNRYLVRLGQFRDRGEAKELARKVEAHGYDVVVEPLSKGRSKSYRLTAQGFTTQKEARAAASHIRRIYRIQPTVVARGA